MNNNLKKGFTLVELSIVLVIIGLLIGGILVAQSLIDSTKMQAFIRQTGQYDSAIALFEDKFGNLPGDNDLFGSTGTVDGLVEDADGAVVDFHGEIGGFWADLAAAGLKNENGNDFTAIRTDGSTGNGTVNENFPGIGIGNNAGLIVAGLTAANYYFAANHVITADVIAPSATNSINPADALAIDSKLDDGDADEGDIRANDVTTLSITENGTTCADANGVYAVTTDTGTCVVAIRIGLNTGVLK